MCFPRTHQLAIGPGTPWWEKGDGRNQKKRAKLQLALRWQQSRFVRRVRRPAAAGRGISLPLSTPLSGTHHSPALTHPPPLPGPHAPPPNRQPQPKPTPLPAPTATRQCLSRATPPQPPQPATTCRTTPSRPPSAAWSRLRPTATVRARQPAAASTGRAACKPTVAVCPRFPATRCPWLPPAPSPIPTHTPISNPIRAPGCLSFQPGESRNYP